MNVLMIYVTAVVHQDQTSKCASELKTGKHQQQCWRG